MDRLNPSKFIEVAQALVAPYAWSDGRPTKRFCFDFQDRFSGQNHIRAFLNVGYGAGEFFSAVDNRRFIAATNSVNLERSCSIGAT